MKKCQYSEDVGMPEFGPIDGNSQNTSLENWSPISAQELDDLHKQIYLLRESVRAQGIKRYLAEKRAESSGRDAEALRAELEAATKMLMCVVSAAGGRVIITPYTLMQELELRRSEFDKDIIFETTPSAIDAARSGAKEAG